MLAVVAWIYGKVVALRNTLYDRGVLDTYELGAHTVSIGNITTGGTGKTPLVAYVATLLAERGEKVCVLTRGYKRKDENQRVLVSDGEQILADAFTSGDEPYELAEKLLGKAIVIADADRLSAGEWAKRKFGVTAFVLDDGLQHRRVRREVDLVCIDATAPFGGGMLLPAGRLREPAESLCRAHAVIITRADLVDDISDLRSQISEIAPGIPVFAARNLIVSVKPPAAASGKAVDKGDSIFAFCAVGNPQSFVDGLAAEGFRVAGSEHFRDHHKYTQQDIDLVERRAQECGAEALVTTAKDAVKLRTLRFTFPCFVVEIDVRVEDPEGFAALL